LDTLTPHTESLAWNIADRILAAGYVPATAVAEARRGALEEAAALAEREADWCDRMGAPGFEAIDLKHPVALQYHEWAAAHRDIATRIRALAKEPPDA